MKFFVLNKFNLIFYEVELVTRTKNFHKIFKLVTRSVTSFCVTRFRNLISELENSEPLVKTKGFKTVLKSFLFLLFVRYYGNRPRSAGILWEFK